ncbi:MAG: hypothetical protein DWI22_04640 [Planctomycetota bacterium]|nr:MAG: hypothetical protein DWI22_04640 [Planctomycetota bacterium]
MVTLVNTLWTRATKVAWLEFGFGDGREIFAVATCVNVSGDFQQDAGKHRRTTTHRKPVKPRQAFQKTVDRLNLRGENQRPFLSAVACSSSSRTDQSRTRMATLQQASITPHPACRPPSPLTTGEKGLREHF